MTCTTFTMFLSSKKCIIYLFLSSEKCTFAQLQLQGKYNHAGLERMLRMKERLHSAAELIEYINEVGMLPLLTIEPSLGWSAEEVVDDDCQYTVLPDGGWEWPLWEWKGDIIRESGCAYGKFFRGKAAFISREWWPDFCNWRRGTRPCPAEGSIEEAIVETLRMNGSMPTRDLRRACGFTEPKMRGKFDGFITRLQMASYIVTEDFVYPEDKHGRQYGGDGRC